MDYNEKHKEDLESAKGWLAIAKETNNKQAVQILESLFPELRESEDERIRKAIIEFFDLQDDNTTYSFVPKKDILAWLEKQGERNTFDTDTIKKKAHQIAWETSKHYDPNACKQEWCEMAALAMASWLEKQGEQNPAWSEEDEKMLDSIIDCIDGLCFIDSDQLNWLKSLKSNH